MAVAVASGAPCLRRFAVPRPGRVLLYAAEDAQHIVRARLEGICAAAGVDLGDLDVHVITAPTLPLDPISVDSIAPSNVRRPPLGVVVPSSDFVNGWARHVERGTRVTEDARRKSAAPGRARSLERRNMFISAGLVAASDAGLKRSKIDPDALAKAIGEHSRRASPQQPQNREQETEMPTRTLILIPVVLSTTILNCYSAEPDVRSSEQNIVSVDSSSSVATPTPNTSRSASRAVQPAGRRGVADSSRRERFVRPKRTGPTTLAAYERSDEVIVKFHEGSRVRLRSGRLDGHEIADSAALSALRSRRGFDEAQVDSDVAVLNALIRNDGPASRTAA